MTVLIQQAHWENAVYDGLGPVPIIGTVAGVVQLQSEANKSYEPMSEEAKKQYNHKTRGTRHTINMNVNPV